MLSTYHRIIDQDVQTLKTIVGNGDVLTDKTDLICYSRDKSMTKHSDYFKKIPEVVVIPETTEEIVQICTFANCKLIPITPRGGGTGFSGNAVPSYGGISLDMKKMNKIIEIDEKNMIVTVQSGINLEMLNNELNKYGVMIGDDPCSFPSASIGGRINTSGVGFRMLRYGNIIDQVIGLIVVLPKGEVIKIGGGGAPKIRKSSVGYPLRYLFFGAMGTLGVISEVILRVFPIPEKIICRSFNYRNITAAFNAAYKIAKIGTGVLSLLTITDKYRLMLVKKIDSKTKIAEYRLSFVIEGTAEEVNVISPRLLNICIEEGGDDLGPEVGKEEFQTRHDFDTAYPGIGYTSGLGIANWQDEEHGLLPTESHDKLFDEFIRIFKKYNFTDDEIFTVCQWGFIPYPLDTIEWRFDERDEERWEDYVNVSREMADVVLKYGGTVSAAHGLGMRRLNNYVQKELGYGFELMKQIKKIFDPNNIMNPGKMRLDLAYT